MSYGKSRFLLPLRSLDLNVAVVRDAPNTEVVIGGGEEVGA